MIEDIKRISPRRLAGLDENIRHEIYQHVKINEHKAEKRNRVDTGTVVMMLIVAVVIDLIQIVLTLIPFVGWILSFFVGLVAWLSFYIWTSIKGWGLSDTIKNAIVWWFLPVLGDIPILNALPLQTVRVLLQVSFLKAEDLLYNTTHGKVELR